MPTPVIASQKRPRLTTCVTTVANRRSPRPSAGSPQEVPAASRIHDRQRGSFGDAQEILIASDEELGSTRQRRGEHPGVIRIAQRETRGGGRSSDDGVAAELVLDPGDLGWRHVESLAQDAAKLREIDFPGEQLVLRDDETE